MSEQKPHILLVDDDDALLRLMTLRLEGEGFTVTAAEDGPVALRKLQTQEFDVVLSDIRTVPYKHITLPTSDLV